jgi:predicted kinase
MSDMDETNDAPNSPVPTAATHIAIPKLSLVVLIGPSGAGKSTFARKHFLGTEVLSSDRCRGLVGDDENDQACTKDAFEVLHFIAEKRLARGLLTVVDATNVQPESRAPLVALARRHHCLPVAIVLDTPEAECQSRNQSRPDRAFGPHVVRQQRQQLRRSLKVLRREGFRHVFVFESAEELERGVIERVPLRNDRRDERGPFDIIGDVHGCADELEELFVRLGYERTTIADPGPGWSSIAYMPPGDRKAVFLGDLVDRGPRVLDSLSIARNMVRAGWALCVPGNHDIKLMRKLRGSDVRITHGLAETLAEIEALDQSVRDEFRVFPRKLAGRIGQPLRARRRSVGRGPRGDEGVDARTGLGQGPGLRAVRGDHGRDGRIRASRATQLGGGVPRRGDGSLRTHAGSGTGMAQSNDQHRHRMRVRWIAHRAAVPGA